MDADALFYWILSDLDVFRPSFIYLFMLCVLVVAADIYFFVVSLLSYENGFGLRGPFDDTGRADL